MSLVICILGLVALRAHTVASCDTTDICDIATSGAVEGLCAVGEAGAVAGTGVACTVGAVFTFGLTCGLALLGTGLLVGGCAAAPSEIESGELSIKSSGYIIIFNVHTFQYQESKLKYHKI